MAKQNVDAILGTTTLITGSDEFLAERTIGEMRDAVKAADADSDLSELDAGGARRRGARRDLQPVVVRGDAVRRRTPLEELPADAVDALVEYVGTPAPMSCSSCTTPAGSKGKAVLDKLRKAGADEVKAEPR